MRKIKKQLEHFIKLEELDLQEEDNYTIEGIAMHFNKETLNGTRYNENVKFEETLPLLYQHDEEKVIGKVNFTKSNSGVDFKAHLNPNIERGKEVWEMVKHGDLTGVSIGALGYEMEYDNKDDVIDIKDYMLYELSVVTIPANQDARIQLVESLKEEQLEEQKEINVVENVEVVEEVKENGGIMNFEEMSVAELTEKRNELNAKLTDKANDIITNQKALESLEDDKEVEEKVNLVESLKEERELFNEELSELELEMKARKERVQDLKNKMYSNEETKKESGGKKMNISATERFLTSENAKNIFAESLKEAMTSQSDVREVYKKNVLNKEGFSGDVAELTPTLVVEEINDLMDEDGRLLNLVSRTYDVDGKLRFFINTSEELGYGWAGDSAEKKEQKNELVSVLIDMDYVYKYIQVSREYFDQPANVLYNYVIKELAERLVLTVERAILVGTPNAVAGDETASITPMTDVELLVGTDNILRTDVEINDLTSDTLEDLDVELKGTEQTVFAMAKKTWSALKKLKTTNGDAFYERGTVVIGSFTYPTLDGFPIYITDFLPTMEEGASTDPAIIGFKYGAYKTIEKSSSADMFTNFKLENNTYQFLTETKIGGDVVKPYKVVIGLIGTPAV